MGHGSKTFTADADTATFGDGVSIISDFGFTFKRTVGATDVVDFDLHGSMNGTDFYKVADLITTVAGGGIYASAVDKPMTIARIVCVTVGAGNTIVARFVGA